MANLGKFQKRKSKKANGQRHMIAPSGKRYQTSPRIATSFPDHVFRRLVWLADAQNVPLGQIIREACESYVHVINAPIDAVQIARLKSSKLAGDQ